MFREGCGPNEKKLQNYEQIQIYFICRLLMIIMTTHSILLSVSISADSLTMTKYRSVDVVYGDTLWTIAQTYMPEDMDIRESVFQLCKLNDIRADQLYAGMTIQVPVY